MTLLGAAVALGISSTVSASAFEPTGLDNTITFATSDDFWQTTGHAPSAVASADAQLAAAVDNRWFTVNFSTILENFRHLSGLVIVIR